MSRLIKYREKLNLTQDELGEKAGISVRTIQRIEAGTKPKGHTLKVLSKALGISEEQLIGEQIEQPYNYQLIKLINLSSLPFIIVPLGSIVVPLLIMYSKKEINSITKQIVSIQILWTIFSGVFFLGSAFVRRVFSPENNLTLIVLIVCILINLCIILFNTISIDKHNRLFISLNFSLI